MSSLRGKVAIITGASSGIGAATAEHFATYGCSLALSGRKIENLETTRQKCISVGLKDDQILVIPGDVTAVQDMETLVNETLHHFSKIDILINAAGILVNGGAVSTSIDKYDDIMNVNVRAIILLTQLCAPHIIKTKGAIVNVSSIAGICAFPGVTYYCISKAAIDQFTKCLALELAPHGVRVNSVNPGVIITEVHKRAGMAEEDYKKFLDHSKTTHALGRPGEAIEVAKAIAFLASDDASFTTGELLRIDGGRGIMTPR